MESNDKDLYQECDDIVDNILNNYASYSNDEKLRKLYIEVGKLLSKSPVFFYERDPEKQKEIYDNYKIILDLKPALDEEKLDKRIQKDFQKYSNKNFENSLNDLLPKQLIPTIVKLSKIDPYLKVNQISKEERKNLVHLIKNIIFRVKNYRPIEEAIITSGGVKTSEINASTMESKLVSGLFFAGEVIDVDAYTGGFNLQIAFSTAYLAGINC